MLSQAVAACCINELTFQWQLRLLKSLFLLQCVHHNEASQKHCQHSLAVSSTAWQGKEVVYSVGSLYNKGGKEKSKQYSSRDNKLSIDAKSSGGNCWPYCEENNGDLFPSIL